MLDALPLPPARGARLLARALRNLGDKPGHEFHGNQYTDIDATIDAVTALDGFIQPDEVFAGHTDHAAVLPANQDLNDPYVTDVVHIGTLYATQDYIGADKAKSIAKGDNKRLRVDVVKKDGKYHIVDGHHQAVAAWARGQETVHVRVHRALRTAGDMEGHPFHGNQWTAGGSITTTSFDGKLSGIKIPERAKNQVYLVRYSNADETKNDDGLGEWSHAHADVNTGIDASAYYSKPRTWVDEKGFLKTAPHEGFIYIGRGDKREVLDKQAGNRGRGNSGEREVLNALTKDNLDVVINVRTGEKTYERKVKALGGIGSGNFNHAGRPGEVGGSAPENGAAHFDRVALQHGVKEGVNVYWDNHPQYPGYSYKKTNEMRAVHPDEPHLGADVMAAVSNGKGIIDTSPENARVSVKALKDWSQGTKKEFDAGESPHHDAIRAAADAHFGITSISPREGSRRTQDEYDAHAKSIVNAIADGVPAQPTLWRGVSDVYAEKLNAAKPGDEVRFSLASTSRDADAAAIYGSETLLRIEAGARGVANRKYFEHDQEVITGGRFKVSRVDTVERNTFDGKPKTVTVVSLKQTETPRW